MKWKFRHRKPSTVTEDRGYTKRESKVVQNTNVPFGSEYINEEKQMQMHHQKRKKIEVDNNSNSNLSKPLNLNQIFQFFYNH